MKKHGNKKEGWLIPYDSGETKLKKFRVSAGMTSAQAAKECGVSAGYYSSIENAQKELTVLMVGKFVAMLRNAGLTDSSIKEILQ